MAQKPYNAYLVRLWRVKQGEQTIWRASIKSVQTGECYSFAQIEGVFIWLWKKTEGRDCQADTRKGGDISVH